MRMFIMDKMKIPNLFRGVYHSRNTLLALSSKNGKSVYTTKNTCFYSSYLIVNNPRNYPHNNPHQKILHNQKYDQQKRYKHSIKETIHFCPYKTLGVTKNACSKEIKKAYIDLCFKLHPDRRNRRNTKASFEKNSNSSINKGEEEELFKKVVQSYELLKDEQRRKAYDLEQSFTQNQTSHSSTHKNHHYPRSQHSAHNNSTHQNNNNNNSYQGDFSWDHFYNYKSEAQKKYKGPVYMESWKFACWLIAFSSCISLGIYYFSYRNRVQYMKHLNELNLKYQKSEQSDMKSPIEQLDYFIEKEEQKIKGSGWDSSSLTEEELNKLKIMRNEEFEKVKNIK